MGRKFDFGVVPFSRERVSSMSNDELFKSINDVKRKIKGARNLGQDTIDIEVEYCYLDHERQMRQRQDEAARKYNKRR